MRLYEFTRLPFPDNKSDEHMDAQYDPENDITGLDSSSTRKTRLTLKQINQLRRLRDVKTVEKDRDAVLAGIQYGQGGGDESNSGGPPMPF